VTKDQKNQRKKRSRSGTLLLISVLLLGSATVRLGIEAGPAIAREMSKVATLETTDVKAGTNADASVDEMQRLLAAFQERERDLKEREMRFEDRLKALQVVETAVDRKLAALTDAEERLNATISFAESASEDDLTRLTDVYQKMKPKEAAALFEEMAPEFAAGFLGRMRAEAAAGIMAGLSPNIAYSISVVLAGRNATVPTE